jgi:hypothetical protein
LWLFLPEKSQIHQRKIYDRNDSQDQNFNYCRRRTPDEKHLVADVNHRGKYYGRANVPTAAIGFFERLGS